MTGFDIAAALSAATDDDEPPGVRALAESLMAKHGLRPGEPGGWTLAFDRSVERAGLCVPAKRVISLSIPLLSLWTQAQRTETILHEIAHALTDGGHGLQWKRMARMIGADPTRTWGHDGEQPIPGKYTGTCPNGHVITRHRLVKGIRRNSCNQCAPRYDPRYVFTWTVNGQPA